MAPKQTHDWEESARESKEAQSSREDNAKNRVRKKKRKYCAFYSYSGKWAVLLFGVVLGRGNSGKEKFHLSL